VPALHPLPTTAPPRLLVHAPLDADSFPPPVPRRGTPFFGDRLDRRCADGAGRRRSPLSPHRASATLSITARIESLVAEEHDLRRREQADSEDTEHLETDQERLRSLQVELDRCWDLLRQRRAREEFGQDPDEAQVRDANTVERYLQ